MYKILIFSTFSLSILCVSSTIFGIKNQNEIITTTESLKAIGFINDRTTDWINPKNNENLELPKKQRYFSYVTAELRNNKDLVIKRNASFFIQSMTAKDEPYLIIDLSTINKKTQDSIYKTIDNYNQPIQLSILYEDFNQEDQSESKIEHICFITNITIKPSFSWPNIVIGGLTLAAALFLVYTHLLKK
jgi:hypothetical protein